jgi:hypothetical protein
MKQVAALLFVILTLTAGSLFADQIFPDSYTATPGEVGSWTYYDDTGTQLTDSVLGSDVWYADLGMGPAYEWVGWLYTDPTIVFSFGGPVNLTSVSIGFNRTEGPSAIYLPLTVDIDGTLFTLTGNELADGTRGFLSFPIAFSGSSLTIKLADNDDQRWIFVDEIEFNGARIPEPGTILLTLSGAAVLWAVRRRRLARHRS